MNLNSVISNIGIDGSLAGWILVIAILVPIAIGLAAVRIKRDKKRTANESE